MVQVSLLRIQESWPWPWAKLFRAPGISFLISKKGRLVAGSP